MIRFSVRGSGPQSPGGQPSFDGASNLELLQSAPQAIVPQGFSRIIFSLSKRNRCSKSSLRAQRTPLGTCKCQKRCNDTNVFCLSTCFKIRSSSANTLDCVFLNVKKCLNAIRRGSRNLVFSPILGGVWYPVVARIVSVEDWCRVSVSERSSPLLRLRMSLSRKCAASDSRGVQLYGSTLGCHQGLTPRCPFSDIISYG